jgi:hypothetical protein
MPPYKAIKSRAQQRKLFALANKGEISMAEAHGKTRAAKGRRIPERVRRRKKARR